MKKFWMILMSAVAVLFAAGCGGGSDSGSSSVACTKGEHKCSNSGSVSLLCSDDGEWLIQRCDSGCNTETGECNNGGDTGDTAADTGADTGDTAADTGDTGNSGGNDDGRYNCKQYGDCLSACGDDACKRQCLNKTNPQEANKYVDLYNCEKDKCSNPMTDQEFTECIYNNCNEEIVACGMQGGSGKEPDTRYNSPYGHLTLNFSVDQIATPSDQEAQQQQGSDNKIGRVESQFAVGNFGNKNLTPVIPAGVDQILSSAGYRNEDGFEGVSISQTFATQVGTDQNNNPEYAMNNPAVVLKIVKDAFAPAQIDVSPFNNPKAYIQVVQMNWDASPAEVVCVHAYGEGKLNITTATGDIANHGSIAFTGEVDLYNMRNFKGYSYDQNNDACEPID